MNIYVGNMARDVTEEDLRQAFEAFGQVESVNLITDKLSGEPRGFGFVEMPAKAEAQAAIDGLNNQELKGRALSVNEARPRRDDHRGGPGRGGPGHGRGGPGGGGRGRGGPGGGGGGRQGGRRY